MNHSYRFSPLPTIGELLKLYRLRALKQLSQNFLLNLRLTDKIVRAAGSIKNCEVCEIGPGPGGITRSIIKRNPSRIVLIEKDERFKPMLENLVEATGFKIETYYSDILEFDMANLFNPSLRKEWEDIPPNIHLIGNLPFNVSTPLIIKWLKNISLKTNAWSFGRVRMTLTFQEEVAQRIVAPENTVERCRMSVMCQNWCKVHHAFTIPGKAFLPKPEVNVGVVHFEPLIEPLIDLDFHVIERVLRIVMNTKNKFLRNAVSNLFPKDRTETLTEEIIQRSGLDHTQRPTTLTNEDWMRFIFAYKTICDREPNLYLYDYRGSRKIREMNWKEETNDEMEKLCIDECLVKNS